MTKKFIAVLEISEKDPYINDLDDLKEEIDKCLYLPGRVVSIKLMPEKYTDMLSYDYDTRERGWNDCLEEIEGDSNGK